MKHLLIMEQVDPEPVPRCRFRIAELIMSIDGPRTRWTYQAFATLDEAKHYVKIVQDKENSNVPIE